MAEEERLSFGEIFALRRAARLRARQRYIGLGVLAVASLLAAVGAFAAHQIAMIGSVTIAIVGHAFFVASFHDPIIPKS